MTYAAGTGLREGTDGEIEDAVGLAAQADVAIVVLGERSGLTDDATTGEFRDRHDLGFMGRQQELLERVVATGTPVVLVVVSGRPLAIEWAAQNCAAVLLAWAPGDAGPEAIADVLTGVANPGGKLPISIPRHVGQVPVSYRHHPTGGRSNPKGPYVDGPTTPLWPFGFGRSYTSFELSTLRLDRAEVPTQDGEVVVTVDVANRGDRRGDEVVQLYVRDVEASVARPVLELLGFRRVGLDPGETRSVSFHVSVEQLAYTGADYRRVIEPGAVQVYAGSSSADLPLTTTLTLVGPAVHLVDRNRYLTGTSAWLTHARRSTRPRSSVPSMNGCSGRSSSTWAGRSTAGSTSPATRPPMPTAGGATCSTSSAASASRWFAIRAATSSRAMTGRTASDRALDARSGGTWPGGRLSPISFGTDDFIAWARAPVPSRCWSSTSARAVPRPPETWSSTSMHPAGTPYADRRVANGTRNRTTSGPGASATRWTVPGRSATRRLPNTGGWQPRRARPCGWSTRRSSW